MAIEEILRPKSDEEILEAMLNKIKVFEQEWFIELEKMNKEYLFDQYIKLKYGDY